LAKKHNFPAPGQYSTKSEVSKGGIIRKAELASYIDDAQYYSSNTPHA